jgi:hypothetical protein
MVKFAPRKESPKAFAGFNESDQIEDYFEDLVSRHGDSIKDFEENIKGCKTLKEAMRMYTKILSNMDSNKFIKVTEALDPEERRTLIESQTGKKIASKSVFESRLPKGWD